MTKNEITKGLWWLPGKPEEKLVGEFSYSGSRGGEVSLFGSLFSLQEGWGPLSGFTVFGLTVRNRPVTLFNCFVRNSNSHFPGGRTAEISTNFAVIGGHFAKLEEISFTTLSCSLNQLLTWVNRSYFTTRFEPDMSKIYIEGNMPSPIPLAEIAGVKVQICPSLNFDPNYASVTLSNGCRLSLDSTTPTTFDSLVETLQGIQELLALAICEPVYAYDLKGTLPRGDKDRTTECEIVQRFMTEPENKKQLRFDQLLFSLSDLLASPEIVSNYFARRRLFMPVCGLFLSTFYNDHMFINHRFLSLAHAVEAFHRVFVGGKYQSDEDYSAGLKLTFQNAIPATIDADFRRSLKNKLKYLHEFSLRKRIQDLAMGFENDITWIIGDVRDFACCVSDERNRLTHQEAGSELVPDGKKLWLYCEQLSLLLELCLLKELGFGSGVLKRVATESPRIEAIKLNTK